MTRRRALILVIILIAAYAGFEYWRSSTAPEPPAISYTGVDEDVAAGIEAARLAVVEHPRSAEHWGRYGMILGAHYFFDPAAICFEVAARYDESNSRWPNLEALQHLTSGRIRQAIPLLRRALALAPTRDERGLMLFNLVVAHIHLGELKEAAEATRELGTIEADSARHRYCRGYVAFSQGKMGEARADLESVANEPTLRKAVCRLLAQTADVSEQESRLAVCRQLPPDEPWFNPHFVEMMKLRIPTRDRMQEYHQLQAGGRAEEAFRLLEHFVATAPDAETTFLLGQELMKRKEYRRAADAFQKSLQFDSRSGRSYLNLATVQYELGEDREAADSATKAIQFQANLSAAHSLRGRALKRLKLVDESIQAFRDAVTSRPESAELHRELGVALAEAGRVAEGLRSLEDAASLAPPGDSTYRETLDKWKAKK